MEEDCSSSINYDQVHVSSYIKYSLLFLPVVEIESASEWNHLEVSGSIPTTTTTKKNTYNN